MTIRVDSNQGIHTIWLARAEKRNAFDGDMLHKLDEALQQAQELETCRVVVIAAEGKAFCAGADLAWMAQQAAEGGEANIRGARTMGGIFHRISDCRKPVVARVHGATMGGGVGLASACDIVVASERAFFALSEVRLGLVPAVISPFVVRRVGPSRARALFMTGGRVAADDAHRFGLVDHLVEHDDDLAALDACLKSVLGDLLKGRGGISRPGRRARYDRPDDRRAARLCRGDRGDHRLSDQAAS
jgi:methylglutaconyl-CoA hydratase